MNYYNGISALGLIGFLAVAWALSTNRRKPNFRVVLWGVAIQLCLGALVFCAPFSHKVLLAVNDGFIKVIDAATSGQAFLFGDLANQQKSGFILAIQGLPLVIFFAALMGLLYYWRIMPLIIRGFAWVFTKLMRISGAEALCAASNIFIGVESTTTIRPFLGKMTRSELCVVLTAGMATIASTVLGLYVFFLKDTFPTIAGHLISASLISAPAAIVMAKLLLPEEETPVTLGTTVTLPPSEEHSGIEAIINGAMAGVKLLVGICALLIAFLGLLALTNLLLGYLGGWGEDGLNWLFVKCGLSWELHLNWSLQGLLGYLFYPFALMMGVPGSEAQWAGELLGERLVATEIPAYQSLAEALRSGDVQPRTAVIMAYALCGFAHVASLAVFVGGTAALVPERRKDLAKIGPRALLAATLACLMTGAVAGIFHTPGAVNLLSTKP